MLIPPVGQALPVVKTLTECVSWSKTVSPFLPQIAVLPRALLANLHSADGLARVYISTNPLVTAFVFALAISPIFLLVSEWNKNYSQVDRVWSILPTVYNAHYAVWTRLNGLPTQRVDAVLFFSLVWSARLTFNYWRRGGYQVGSEDYRWVIVRGYVNAWQMFLFNVVFISLAQSILLFSVTTPTYILLLTSRLSASHTADYVFAGLLVATVVIEFVADQQQWNYQSAKKSYQETAKVPDGYSRVDLDRGFNTTGLWRYSRHPNFAAEQTVWMMAYQWSCWQAMTGYSWTFIGAASYLILFQASTWLTEGITAKKYADYSLYQQRVGKFLPKLTGAGWDDSVGARTKSDKST